MKNWESALIPEGIAIREALKVIDTARIGLVVDADRRLLGTVTDGDIRRGILRSISLHDPVDQVMNATPFTASATLSRAEIRAMPAAGKYRFVPVIDSHGCVVGLEGVVTTVSPQIRSNLVVLMAGGLGKRLRPLTESTPKPMLQVGSRPLLETILIHIAEQGFNQFLISVNYKAEMVKDHFGDGRQWNAEIRYLEETREMGTAGALSLLPEVPTEPIIIMNGDLLTKIDLLHLLDYHAEHGSMATMCVREYDFQVPYGVVHIDGHRIKSIEEKPIHRFFVNAGIYVLSPEVLFLVDKDEFLDMPRLFDRLISRSLPSAVFPIREYWMDIGLPDDYHQANREFDTVFP
ncbi:nucleotidyltransferase family protein [Magnetospirillum sulfuroxidans]|uniref:Nucleotidyltransferase family protein n=1 Tax=Magnetospirillum sulfuroxidans TaxID=611300 RepID=A0ABS5IH59_9PROT|nr:nucleotidyltransferase family protein [Magnetospirillum sulfuroxidans]